MKTGIIGGQGWIGSSLGRALIETGKCKATDLVILNRAGAPGDFHGYPVIWARDVADLVDRSDVIVVSVRPQDWPALALDARGKLVISLMAVVPLSDMPPRSLRAMPNAASELRRSFLPWYAGAGVSAEDRRVAVGILSAIGTCGELASEDQLDLMGATVGAGPAYTALLAQSVIGFLVDNGVDRTLAEQAADGMICGTAPLLAGKMDQAGEMVRVFIDYRGMTAAGLNAAVAGGFDTALRSAFQAAIDKGRDMARDI